ncbi:23S rRNA (uracil(1939)-C(5))-methyltransferase RlmD [bacterium]|nr:23S rRNA (uracil(1939)-C(5))-methyltransferase RlmD [bacterium]
MGEPLKLGSRVPLKVDDIAAGGEAVGRVDNFVIFVPQGAPGDELEVEVIELRKNYGRAHISKIIKPSIRRVQPPCPVYHQCGGCQLQHIDYDAQLFYKTKIVKDSIQHLTDLGTIKVHPCRRLDDPWNYRNKVQAVVAAKPYLHPKDTEKGRISHVVGLYAQGTHRVIKIDECLIQDTLNNKILQASREAMERLQWPVYNEKDGSGLVRYLVTRASYSTREALLVVVAAQPRLPQVQEFLNHVKRRVPQLKGVLLNLNPHQTNVVLGNRTQVLWGKDHLIEDLLGLKFQISPTSFFQVNTRGLLMMYDVLEHYCDLRGKDTAVDLYCGVGSLSLLMAKRAKRVLGVDISLDAIEDAVVNSDLNGFKNTDFLAGASEKVLPQLYRQGQRFQLALLDPPRKGCDGEVLQVLARMRIPRVVYVSCNPSSLARDLEILTGLGYQVHEIQPLDMFPQTYHVECVARLSLVGDGKSR